MTPQTADKEMPSYLVRLQGLDAARSKRMYIALTRLSEKAVEALKNKDMKSFSALTDKMRPLLSYININSVTLSSHLANQKFQFNLNTEIDENELKEFVPKLRSNLKTIENARNAISTVPFQPAVLASQEITDLFLDHFIPMAWDFDFDVIILVNLGNERLLDYLIERGQKRFFLIGSSLDESIILDKLDRPDILFWAHKEASIIRELFLGITGKPPSQFIAIDCGEEKQDLTDKERMISEASTGRQMSWWRFNTINRADAVKTLANLHNLVRFKQTSELHGKFKGIPGVVVSPGPSLTDNISTLKKVKGRALIICVLRALGTLLENDIIPDIVIQVDPFNLKEMQGTKNNKKINLWDEWIEKNDLSKIKLFINSLNADPNIFDIPAQSTMWMNPALPISEYLPFDVFDYKRNGGSVSHSAFDLMIEFGCSSIALVGQDLAYSKEGTNVYTETATTNKFGDEAHTSKFGDDIEVEGLNGTTVKTNNVFWNFARHFTFFSEHLDKQIKLFNCTEGGMYIDGFTHCTLERFLENECSKVVDKKIDEILHSESKSFDNKKLANVVNKFIGKNLVLTEELASLLKKIKKVINKKELSYDDLGVFDKLQNRIIKKMAENQFYTFALQKDMHILEAGLKADSVVETQVGFHKDFLIAADLANENFKSEFSHQKTLLNKNQ